MVLYARGLSNQMVVRVHGWRYRVSALHVFLNHDSRFVLLPVQYGRNSLADITREVDGKAEEEVSTYTKTFWRRYKELSDWERVIKNIGAPRDLQQTLLFPSSWAHCSFLEGYHVGVRVLNQQLGCDWQSAESSASKGSRTS